MIPLAVRGILSALKTGSRYGKTIKPSKLKETYMRGETLPYSVGLPGNQLKYHGIESGRYVTQIPSIASKYSTNAMGKGVPIIRSKKITPSLKEIAFDDPDGHVLRQFKAYPSTIVLDQTRKQFPVDRTRSIIENLKQAMVYRSKFAVPSQNKNFFGIRDLLRKIKDPEQKEILKKLFFGDITNLKKGGRV